MNEKELQDFQASELQYRLDSVMHMIKTCGFDIRATWMDEFGGPQSVFGGVHVIVEKGEKYD